MRLLSGRLLNQVLALQQAHLLHFANYSSVFEDWQRLFATLQQHLDLLMVLKPDLHASLRTKAILLGLIPIIASLRLVAVDHLSQANSRTRVKILRWKP
jgi:hypothetical protein